MKIVIGNIMQHCKIDKTKIYNHSEIVIKESRHGIMGGYLAHAIEQIYKI